MCGTTGDFLNVREAIDESRYITRSHIWVARAKTTVCIAAHGVYIASIALHEHCMLLAAANFSHHDIKAAHFRQIVDDLVTADTQLSIIIIYDKQ